MKKLLFILLLFTCANLLATTYYVKTGGSDAAAGTSDATAWATIAKVNTFWAAYSFVPGDSILFNKGDTWHEKLVISESGTSGNPIVISSYGTGAIPVINGFETIGMWTQLNDSVDYVVIETSNNPTFVAVDGDWKAMGRYPNSSYLTITANPATGTIVSTGLGNTPNWTGAEAVIRVRNWILDRCSITLHNTDTITYTRRSAYNPVVGWGFFIQNAIETLDTQFEWFYDGDTLFMHNGGESLGLYTIQVSTIDTLLEATNFDYIHVDGIKFTGSGRNAIHTRQYTDYWEIKNCEFDLNGYNAIYFANQQRNSLVDNNTINRSVQAGIYMLSSGNNTVTNNEIKNSGMLLGGTLTGTQNNGIYSSDHVYGANNLFQYNRIDSSGYNGLYFLGHNTKVKNNFITNSVLLLNDGGGIYTQGLNSSGRVIEGNIVLGSYGNVDGTLLVKNWVSEYDTIRYGEGIYLDAGGTTAYAHGIYDVNVINNTSANNSSNGITVHEAYNDTVTGNLCYNNKSAIKFQSFTTGIDSANYMYNNVMFARKYIDHYTFRTNLPATAINSDYNYFLRPVSDYENIAIWFPGGWQAKDLTYWQSEYGLDLNSTGSQETASDENQFTFIYNPTKADSTFTMTDDLLTIDFEKFTGDTVLSAYSSAVFMIDPSPGASSEPTVVSDSVQVKTRKHLFVFGNVTADGGETVTETGICYSTVGFPTVDSTKVVAGSGTGTFGVRLSNMLKSTNYYIRPYAINSIGPGYGNTYTVTTPAYNIFFKDGAPLVKNGYLVKYDPDVDQVPPTAFELLMAEDSTKAEFIYTEGVTTVNDSVSVWGNQRGATNLAQTAQGMRPILGSDGILFDGADLPNADRLVSAITLAQPTQIYIVVKQVSWTANRFLIGKDNYLQQRTSSPNLRMGDWTNEKWVGLNSNLVVGEWGIVSMFFNGANSVLQIDDTNATTGDAGSLALENFTIGNYAAADNINGSNINVKHIIIRQALNFATDKEIIKAELKSLYGL